MPTAEKVKHTPGDVNHQMLGHAGYEFCPTCGSSLRGKRTALEAEMLEALEGLNAYWDGVLIPGQPGSLSAGQLVNLVKAAIRKVRGEQ